MRVSLLVVSWHAGQLFLCQSVAFHHITVCTGASVYDGEGFRDDGWMGGGGVKMDLG